MGFWPFRRSRAENDAETLLVQVMAAARRPTLYGPGGIPDSLDGRFEAMALFASFALIRLRTEPEAGDLAQVFTDKLFRHLDAGLREAGVGDLSVPKRMRALAASFYGRLAAYSEAIERGEGLEGALIRHIGVSDTFAADQAPGFNRLASVQATRPVTALFTADGWAG